MYPVEKPLYWNAPRKKIKKIKIVEVWSPFDQRQTNRQTGASYATKPGASSWPQPQASTWVKPTNVTEIQNPRLGRIRAV